MILDKEAFVNHKDINSLKPTAYFLPNVLWNVEQVTRLLLQLTIGIMRVQNNSPLAQ